MMFSSLRKFSVEETFVGQRWEGEYATACEDVIANETAIALVYNGVPHVVMMATPQDIEDFALGFSISEGIVHAPDELFGMRLRAQRDGIEANIEIAGPRFKELDRKQRNLTGRIGCGLCGAQTLAQAVRHPRPVLRTMSMSPLQLQTAMSCLAAKQPLNNATGAVHAAAWVGTNGEIELVREDVGRHNALDKLIGAMLRQRLDFSRGAVLITSRASYEMVQKAAMVGIEIVAAISAPTALAIRVANETAITLLAFARHNKHTVYTFSERVAVAKETVTA